VYGAALIILLIALGGVIAYVGDMVGRRVGRQRLTLFGLRPKHTSVIIAVITGIIVVGTTLATLIIVDNDFREMLLDYDSVKSELVATQGNLTRTQEKLRGVVEELNLKLQELDEKQSKIDELQASIQPLEEKIDRLHLEIQEKTSKNQELQTVNEQLSRQVDELDSKVKLKEEALQEAEQNLQLAMQRLREVEKSYEGTSQQLLEAQAELKQASDELGRIKSELETTRSELEKKKDELQGAQHQIRELEKDRSELQTQMDNLIREKKNLEDQRAQLIGERDLLRIDRDQLLTEKAGLEDEVESLRGRIESLNAQIDSLNGEISKLTEERNRLTQDISNLSAKYEELWEKYDLSRLTFGTLYEQLLLGTVQGRIWGVKGALIDNWVVGAGDTETLQQHLDSLARRVERVWNKGFQVLEPDLSAARRIVSEASDKVLVRAILAENVYEDDRLTKVVRVNLEVRNRTRLFEKGEIVAYAQSPIDPRESDAYEIMETLSKIGQSARQKAIDLGMYVFPDGTVGVDTSDSVDATVRKVLELSEPVRLYLKADEDVFNTDGPIKWSFDFFTETYWKSRLEQHLK